MKRSPLGTTIADADETSAALHQVVRDGDWEGRMRRRGRVEGVEWEGGCRCHGMGRGETEGGEKSEVRAN